MITEIIKRDGRRAPFQIEKITDAIYAAAQASGGRDREMAERLAQQVVQLLDNENMITLPTVEQIQDAVEKVLVKNGHARTAKKYILYRNERTRAREMNTRLMKVYEDLTFKSSLENDIKRENANIDGDTAMGTMLKYGSEGAKQFCEMFILDTEHSRAHREGDIHIHDMDFYTLTTTCCQIDLLKLFKDGFSTGHGFLREPKDIRSYSALACIALQSNQNDQHGGQSVPNFDYALAPGVAKTFRKSYRDNLAKALDVYAGIDTCEELARTLLADVEKQTGLEPLYDGSNSFDAAMLERLQATVGEEADKILAFTRKYATKSTKRATYQAMEALVHNLNTISFSLDNILAVEKLRPLQAKQFLIHQKNAEEAIEAVRSHPMDVDVKYPVATAEFIDEMHALGCKVNTWTVNTEEDAARLIDAGVDFITTDILE